VLLPVVFPAAGLAGGLAMLVSCKCLVLSLCRLFCREDCVVGNDNDHVADGRW
jgi:hypothetical protein